MNKALRKAIISGNWKMNLTPAEGVKLVNELKELVGDMNGCEIIVCVPFTDIAPVAEAAKGTNIKVGAQNVHYEKSGAYTGEISVDMLKECGAEYAVVGHSERRQYFGETDKTVNLRAKAALAGGIIPIICVGELLEQRDLGITGEIVSMQTKIALEGISASDVEKLIIAYEPVWAIGTGRTATAEQAQEVCAEIRGVIAGLYGSDTANRVTIQYGGSMKPGNADELLAKPDVDGGLIGGASLKAADFASIVKAAN